MDASTSYIVLSIAIVLLIASLALTILWINMILHAVTQPIANKMIWIAVLIFFGPFSAIVYYYMVKKPMSYQPFNGTTSFQ